MNNMTILGIGDVARQAGISASAIRYYESIGLLAPAPRQGGKRRYHRTILDRLKVIEIAKSLDFSLKEIKVLVDGISEGNTIDTAWRTLARNKLQAIETRILHAQRIKHLLTLGLSCDCNAPANCVLSAPSVDVPDIQRGE